jgi:hypothetical protein
LDALIARSELITTTMNAELVDRAGAECIADLVRQAVGTDELVAVVDGRPSSSFDISFDHAVRVCATVSNPTTTTVAAAITPVTDTTSGDGTTPA